QHLFLVKANVAAASSAEVVSAGGTRELLAAVLGLGARWVVVLVAHRAHHAPDNLAVEIPVTTAGGTVLHRVKSVQRYDQLLAAIDSIAKSHVGFQEFSVQYTILNLIAHQWREQSRYDGDSYADKVHSLLNPRVSGRHRPAGGGSGERRELLAAVLGLGARWVVVLEAHRVQHAPDNLPVEIPVAAAGGTVHRVISAHRDELLAAVGSIFKSRVEFHAFSVGNSIFYITVTA
ncbi:enolase 1, partial [Striga asiatica]